MTIEYLLLGEIMEEFSLHSAPFKDINGASRLNGPVMEQ